MITILLDHSSQMLAGAHSVSSSTSLVKQKRRAKTATNSGVAGLAGSGSALTKPVTEPVTKPVGVHTIPAPTGPCGAAVLKEGSNSRAKVCVRNMIGGDLAKVRRVLSHN